MAAQETAFIFISLATQFRRTPLWSNELARPRWVSVASGNLFTCRLFQSPATVSAQE